MARYAQMYHEANEKLLGSEAKLAKAIADRDNYRNFIQESGGTRAFMIWWAREQGFREETVQWLESAIPEIAPQAS